MNSAIQLPNWLQAGFIGVVLAVYAFFAILVGRTFPGARNLIRILTVWLAFTGLLAQGGYFADFTSVPPRIPVFAAVQIGFIVWLVFKSDWADGLSRIPQTALIGMQSFRIVVEFLLAGLATANLLPHEMSWQGWNFDFITGVTAIGVALWIARGGEAGRRFPILLWNCLGLALLFNVVFTAMLSTPYPFQVLHFSVDNFIIGYFPVTWLPLFLVPMAVLLHLISIRRALRNP